MHTLPKNKKTRGAVSRTNMDEGGLRQVHSTGEQTEGHVSMVNTDQGGPKNTLPREQQAV